MEKLIELIEKSNGAIFVGKNSDGKTSMLKELTKCYSGNNKQVLYIPENIKTLETQLVEGIIEQTSQPLKNIEEFLDEVLTTTNDPNKGNISYVLKDNQDEKIFEFFKNKLGFELFFQKGSLEIKRKDKNKIEELTSTGYKLMIRVSSEIYFYLKTFNKNENIYILVDEIDDKLYWENSQKFFRELFLFLFQDYPNIKFMFSTNIAESLYTVPKKFGNLDLNFKIIKFYQNENLEINYFDYDSRDFFTNNAIDKIIFDKNDLLIPPSAHFVKLETLYKTCLKCQKTNCISCYYYEKFNEFNLSELTIKEQILYQSIKELILNE